MMTATRITAVMSVLPGAHWYVPELVAAIPVEYHKHLRAALELMEYGGILEIGRESDALGNRRYYKWVGRPIASVVSATA